MDWLVRRVGYMLGVAIVACAMTARAAADVPEHRAWEILNRAVEEAHSRGAYTEGIAAAKQALQFARDNFGPQDPNTLVSMDGLARLYRDNGQYSEAQPLLEEVLQLRREALGAIAPDTIESINRLGLLYRYENRYDDAERLYLEAMRLAQSTGPHNDVEAANVKHNLGSLYRVEGRYLEAEQILLDALEIRTRMHGRDDVATLSTSNAIATLYIDWGRYGEAESQLREALRSRQKVLGLRHPDTITSMSNLGALYRLQGRADDSERLYRDALALRRDVLGPHHPDTIVSMNNLAVLLTYVDRYEEAEKLLREAIKSIPWGHDAHNPLRLNLLDVLGAAYARQGRYHDAEPLFHEALLLRRQTLGAHHPGTIAAMQNLADLYRAETRYTDAEQLYDEVMVDDREVFGITHPHTLRSTLSAATNLAAQGRISDAIGLLSAVAPEVLERLGAQLYTSDNTAARRGLIASQGNYQDLVLTLAVAADAPEAAKALGASTLLRLKGIAVEEEAFLARLTRTSADPEVRAAAAVVEGLRTQLANLTTRSESEGGITVRREQLEALRARLDVAEAALGQLSRRYAEGLQERQASAERLQVALAGPPAGSALLEMHQYQPVDFRTGSVRAPHWAGFLITAHAIRVRDLGPVTGTQAQVRMLADGSEAAVEAALRGLHDQLVAPFSAELTGVDRLYVAPDGALYLVPFGLLRNADGRALLETTDVRLLQTGRDLLRQDLNEPRRGLLALGGIDFDQQPRVVETEVQGESHAASYACTRAPLQLAQLARTGVADPAGAHYARDKSAGVLRDGFGPLPQSAREVEEIARLYCAARGDEPVDVWTGAAASKVRLMELAPPPRVLHFATHGFYREPTEPADRPLLLSGVALAGANRVLGTQDADGILYAIEALGLNLEGTELVVLSACKTAQGQVEDYGEGVAGMVRALRTAGARQVLVALRTVGDAAAAEFMQRFYGYLLGDAEGDAAVAIRRTQLDYMNDQPSAAPNASTALGTKAAAAPGQGQMDSDSIKHRGGDSLGKSAAADPAPTWASFILVGK